MGRNEGPLQNSRCGAQNELTVRLPDQELGRKSARRRVTYLLDGVIRMEQRRQRRRSLGVRRRTSGATLARLIAAPSARRLEHLLGRFSCFPRRFAQRGRQAELWPLRRKLLPPAGQADGCLRSGGSPPAGVESAGTFRRGGAATLLAGPFHRASLSDASVGVRARNGVVSNRTGCVARPVMRPS